MRSTRVPTALAPFLPMMRSPLPVAGNRAVVGLGWPLADHPHVRHRAGPLRGALGLAPGASRSQASGEFPAQFASALHVEALVDRLVAHAHPGVVGVVKEQSIRDLLGRVHILICWLALLLVRVAAVTLTGTAGTVVQSTEPTDAQRA